MGSSAPLAKSGVLLPQDSSSSGSSCSSVSASPCSKGRLRSSPRKFEGVVEIDETYIGGKARNMHADRRKAVMKGGKRVKVHAGKVGVMGFYSVAVRFVLP